MSEIDLTDVIVALINALMPIVIAVAVGIINAKIKNQQMATLLGNAVRNSLGAVQQHATNKLISNRVVVPGFSPEINAGVDYVLRHAKEAIDHYKMDHAKIAEKIQVQLGLADIATNLATTASPIPVIAGPLGPVSENSQVQV
jgi:hypothetical protein